MTTTTEPKPLPIGTFKIASDSPLLRVYVPPVVEIKDYIRTLGFSIPAKFDLSEVPPRYHNMILQAILATRKNIVSL